MVLAAHREGRIWATAIRPSVIYGRRDRQFVPRVARLLRIGAAPLIGDGRNTLAIVHAANVADGALRAAATPAAGGVAYNVANDGAVSVREFVRLAGEGLGRRIAVVRIPQWLAHAGLFAAKSGVSLLRGGSIALRVGSTLDFLTRDNPFSSDLARRELGWTPVVTPDVGLPEAFRWWLRERAA
jgi:nucleoside-diphosphate-sugar epimerase